MACARQHKNLNGYTVFAIRGTIELIYKHNAIEHRLYGRAVWPNTEGPGGRPKIGYGLLMTLLCQFITK